MGEYSYPSVIQTADGALHVSYTFRRESIRYVPAVSRAAERPASRNAAHWCTFGGERRYARISEDWIRQGATIGVFKS